MGVIIDLFLVDHKFETIECDSYGRTLRAADTDVTVIIMRPCI